MRRLKVLLAQDRVAEAQRALTYHRYLQRDRAQRIRALTAELQAAGCARTARSRTARSAARNHRSARNASNWRSSNRRDAARHAGRAARPALPGPRRARESAGPRRQGLAATACAVARRRGEGGQGTRARPQRKPATHAETVARCRHRARRCARPWSSATGVAGRRPRLAVVRQPAGRLRRHHARRPQQRRRADRRRAPAARSRRSPTAAWCSPNG